MRAFAGEPWSRPRKIIIGVDIGTTQSAVSFAFLYPGGPQSLYRVAKWPGQDSQKGESKIPTIVYYDQNDEAVLFGAEAAKITTSEAEDQGWRLARHFKLHLHPKVMQNKFNLKVQPLPGGIPLEKIYTDFMVYLMQHTQATFESRVMGGDKVWKELRDDMTIVLAHPNGWTIKEQNFLRQAAVAAKYATAAKGHAQIQFVSEAEASMHFCMFHSDIHRRLEPGISLVVCDAGGSTVDTTAYRVKNTSPVLELEEIKDSACVQTGGVFVDLECENHLEGILSKIELDKEERNDYVQEGVKDFEAFTKQSFGLKGPHGALPPEHRVDMRCRLQRPEHKIKRGVVTLTTEIVRGFFDNCVTRIVSSIRQQMSGFNPEHILLVGGFGDSPYLRDRLLSEFSSGECSVTTANELTSKAVADGAVIWSAKQSVIKRATRMPYGVAVAETYNSRDPNHMGRVTYRHADGTKHVRGYWSQIVGKGVVVDTAQATRRSYLNHCMRGLTIENYLTSGYTINMASNLNPGYEKICEVEADLSGMGGALQKKSGPGGDYYEHIFTVALQFGGTELRAFLEWKADGKTRTGPASILPSALTIVQN
ncbi:hypothetical protein FRC12_001400 [Ceratobasidium sp. 428]|nr:hypothetical protein FRC12_001400 [Ceratobasidium sp. 428]